MAKRQLGALEPKDDPRTLRLASVLLPATAQAAYDCDAPLVARGLRFTPDPMYGNDRYGDCVIAGRAHQTRRFEAYETGRIPAITTSEVVREYLAETGGADTGLYVLDSLSLWRTRGWTAGGRRLFCLAYGAVNWKNPTEVKLAMQLRRGVGVSLALPVDAERQIDSGKPWTTRGDGKTGTHRPGSWGYHYVYVQAYDPTWVTCITWGQRQQMSWPWLATYGAEMFGIIDAKDVAAGLVSGPALTAYLADKAPVLSA